MLAGKRLLVVGGAGSIGSTVSEILFGMAPGKMHVVDVNENALADLVRQLRSTVGYVTADFQAICFDLLHPRGELLLDRNGPYDIILNFAAVKHVRSEKDPFTLSRMFAVNIKLMKVLAHWAEISHAETLFSVSTDKAANPVNLMGASKRIMELVGFSYGAGRFSTSRFANVAFSNGSLLKAVLDRIERGQPITAPVNIKRFFITNQEAARLCLISALAGPKESIAIPEAPNQVTLTSFTEVISNILASHGYKPLFCESEDEARSTKPSKTHWPCYFFESDTSGEKKFEEFVGDGEMIIDSPFEEISYVSRPKEVNSSALDAILKIDPIDMTKEEVALRTAEVIPMFCHVEKGKSLDERM